MLQPYRLIKDHRTKTEVGDVDKVIDGDLQPFIGAYLRMRRGEKQGGQDAGNTWDRRLTCAGTGVKATRIKRAGSIMVV